METQRREADRESKMSPDNPPEHSSDVIETQEEARLRMIPILEERNELAVRLLEQGNGIGFNDLRKDFPNWVPELTNLKARGVNLTWVNLSGANLSGAAIVRCDLRWADLRGANLSLAGFEGTTFEYAKMNGTSFAHSYLDFADLRHTRGLTPEQVLTFNFEKVLLDLELREKAMELKDKKK